jgi:hypothetical protein
MRKTRKLAAVMAVALGVGITPYANAVIELKHNATGDAMLFPVFNGYVENYFTISNNHDAWVQGHLRFRGAAWSGELRDFDVILSPGDVFVFRVADLDGDGMWEIDQSLDPKNFEYTDQLVTNSADKRGCATSTPATPCMKPSTRLIPTADAVISQAIIDHHQHVGYVEFFGEAVLDGMTHTIMNQLVSQTGNKGGGCTNIFNHQSKAFSGRGTNAWMWSDSDNADYTKGTPGTCDRGLSDVPNVLSGTAFITIPGASTGIAYNAEVFTNFRTATADTVSITPDNNIPMDDDIYAVPFVGTPPAIAIQIPGPPTIAYQEGKHRIDNYIRNSRLKFPTGTANSHPNELVAGVINLDAENRAVILHDESGGQGAGTSPKGDYVYAYVGGCPAGSSVENRQDECRISFNNTWGPTLLDGDDYFLGATPAFNRGLNIYNGIGPLRNMTEVGCPGGVANATWDDYDDFDRRFCPSAPDGLVNSLAEVEEAIRIGGQKFFSYYFDDAPFDMSAGGGNALLKSFYFAYFPTKFFWFELVVPPVAPDVIPYTRAAVGNMLSRAKPLSVEVWDIFENSGGHSTSGCISPDPCGERRDIVLGFELNFFDIDFLKVPFNLGNVAGYQTGRVAISPAGNSNDPVNAPLADTSVWPGLFYTFEIDSDFNLGHWRSMQRGR